MDAGLNVSLRRLESTREPTGSPESMYARTRECSTSRCLVLSGTSILIGPLRTLAKHDCNGGPSIGSTCLHRSELGENAANLRRIPHSHDMCALRPEIFLR